MDFSDIIQDARNKLAALPARPTVEVVAEAHHCVASIDRKIIESLENLKDPTSSGVSGDAETFKILQATRSSAIVADAEAEKLPFLQILGVVKNHNHYEEVIRQAELGRVAVDQNGELKRLSREEAERKLHEDILAAIESGAQEVDLKNRNIEYLPEVIGKLVSLKKLDLSNNLLQSVPDAIAGLHYLEEFNLSGNQLKELPDSIGALHSLKKLDVSKNQLKRLPESICFCGAMEEFSARFNKLETIPEGLGNSMPHLRSLDLGLNKLWNLPKSLGNLSTLETLDVHFNMISKVPASLGRLPNLRTLNLSDNFSDLKQLPASLADLCALTDLNLSNNQIQELPVEFGRLTQLQTLALQGNNLKEPPMDLVAKNDTELVTQYLAARLRNHLAQQPSTWTDWLAELLGGDLDGFGKWLNGLMAPGSLQLEGATAAAQNSARVMELTNVQQMPSVDLEAQAHNEALLPVSASPVKALV